MTDARVDGFDVVVSIRRETLPRPGAPPRTWAWTDVLASPPPKKAVQSREGEYVVRHGFDDGSEDLSTRVGYASVLTWKARDDESARVRVEERITVEARILPRILAAERAVTRRVEATARAGDALMSRGARAISTRSPKGVGRAVEQGAGVIRFGNAFVVRTLSDTTRAVAEAPDRFWVGANAADAHLAHAHERRALARGFWNPYALSAEGKTAALFIGSALVGGVILLTTLALMLVAPSVLEAWSALVAFFGVGILSTVLLPLFPELRLREVAEATSGPAAIAAIVLGMTAGAWIVLFLGSTIHAGVRRSVRVDSPAAKLLDRAESFAARHGFWAAFLILAIPFGPDTPVFYVLAAVQTPASKYFLGAILGTLTRYTLVYTLSTQFDGSFLAEYLAP